MIASGLNLQADVLKVGHHGSRTATNQTFLDQVNPIYAVISAGLNNTYGHPHNETVEKLHSNGVTTYCTMNSGTIIAKTDGTTITFQDNPQPIPETTTGHIIPLIAAVTIIALLIYRKNNTCTLPFAPKNTQCSLYALEH